MKTPRSMILRSEIAVSSDSFRDNARVINNCTIELKRFIREQDSITKIKVERVYISK